MDVSRIGEQQNSQTAAGAAWRLGLGVRLGGTKEQQKKPYERSHPDEGHARMAEYFQGRISFEQVARRGHREGQSR